jgi:4-amino-4-deoxy-L-arabinose transferase-like glycosyltransferase
MSRTVVGQAPTRPTEREARGPAKSLSGRALQPLLGLSRRVPAAAWLCALVACLNAASWSLITPPLQVPDEPEHVAYVKQVAENGRLPSHLGGFSAEEAIALQDLRLQTVAEEPEYQTISSQAQEQKLQHDLLEAEGPPEAGSEYAGVAASEPPLYYALQAIPYHLGVGGTLLDRIELMRLLSALMGGLTALFTFLFVRETLPRVRWAWVVGGLGVALVPLLGFMSGAVNPDSMLYAVSAALFYCLAHAFRHGLTRPRAITIGTLVTVGLLTKLNFVGIAPGVLLGLIVLSVRAARTQGRAAYVSLAIALAIALGPVALYVADNLASGESALGFVSEAIGPVRAPLAELSYIWQLYLPRLPGMHADFAGVFTTQKIWFNGYVGLYGWLDTTFPGWVYELALLPAALIAGLCVRELINSAATLRARAAEIAVYGVICVGLAGLIGADSYVRFPNADAEFGQARYLLPLLPLLGLALALAARGVGRRWGPIAGAAIVVLFLGHDVFSQLQEVARFYG